MKEEWGMTSRERVLATIKGEPTDRIPVYHLQFAGQVASVILGREDVCVGGEHLQRLEMNALWHGEEAHREFVARCEEDAVAIAEACGHDILRLQYWRWPRMPIEKIDDNTFVFEMPDGQIVTMAYRPELELFERTVKGDDGGRTAVTRLGEEEPPTEDEVRREAEQAEESAANYKPSPEPNAALKADIEKYPDYLVRGGGGTVSVSMASIRELMAIAYWPELVARKMMARAVRLAKDMPAMAAAGLEVNISGGDFCSSRGPSISPDAFHDIITPALKVIVDACHQNGMYYFFTSDGNFWPVAEDMFNVAGVDGWLETDKSSGMDMRKLRERFPDKVFVGNIQSQVVHRGTVAEVVAEVMDCMEVAHDLGGVIVGVSNLIMTGSPPENIEALLRTIEGNR